MNVHMTKRPSQSEHEYKSLTLDVKGHQRVVLEDADARPDGSGKSKTKFFGIQWAN